MEKVQLYSSKDSVLFDTLEECAHHEGLVPCFCCKGIGTESYEHRTPYPTGLPDSGWVPDHTTIKTRKCWRCDGIGYVVSNIEEDPEFQLYKKLKEKFKDL